MNRMKTNGLRETIDSILLGTDRSHTSIVMQTGHMWGSRHTVVIMADSGFLPMTACTLYDNMQECYWLTVVTRIRLDKNMGLRELTVISIGDGM